MAKGTTKATVHGVFRDRLYDIKDTWSKKLEEDFRGEGQRVWMIPKGLEGQGTELTNVPALHNPDFERSPINTNYLECMSGVEEKAGTRGDVISLKLQMDYNAMEERAFRSRHATVARCLTHQHSRHDGHEKSEVFPQIEKQADDCITVGGQ